MHLLEAGGRKLKVNSALDFSLPPMTYREHVPSEYSVPPSPPSGLPGPIARLCTCLPIFSGDRQAILQESPFLLQRLHP